MVGRLMAATAASALLVSAVATGASAQGAFAYSGAQGKIGHQAVGRTYFDLPTRIAVRPGTVRILRPRCDSSYPMDEGSCGTATGGPVGGMGS